MTALTETKAAVFALIERGMASWIAELQPLVPRRFLRRPDKAAAILEVSATRAMLLLSGAGTAQAVAIPIGDDPQQDRATIQAALRGKSGKAVVIRLDPSLVLEASVTLPLKAEHSLRQILAHQLDRLVPLPADAVEFAHLVIGRSTAGNTLDVRLIVATHASIDRAIALVRSVGLDPGVVIAPAGIAGSDVTVTLRRLDRNAVSTMQRRLRRGLEAAAVVLFLAAYGTYVYRLSEYRDRLTHDVSLAAKASAASRDLVNRDAQTQSVLTLLEQRQRELDPLFLLDELTGLVPDTMWVSQLSVRGRNVELIGYSPRVRDLIARIQDHDIFYDPKLRSPITMSADGRGERFDISFDVWIGAAP